MKKIISVLTATRAEYGLLKPIITKLNKIEEFDVRIVVTGAHLSQDFGLTYHEIEADGFIIDKKIEILSDVDTQSSVSKAMGKALIGFADYFEELNPDMLIVLGDRYETLAVASAAMNQRIPIAHLYGGEITSGAVDDVIRHAITKLSYLHFTSTEEYRSRVIQLGENPDRVFCVGAIGIENIKNEKLLSKEEVAKTLGISEEKDYGVVTFHPVTLDQDSSVEQVKNLLEALKLFKDMNFIVTKANADFQGSLINQIVDEYAKESDNIMSFSSLGMKKYLSALKYSAMVIGNSSSGLVEAPSFGVPTINIGDRQKGRAQAESVINCESEVKGIENAIRKARTEIFIKQAKETINPYGDGNTSEKVIEVIKEYLLNKKIDLKKTFYDCEVKR